MFGSGLRGRRGDEWMRGLGLGFTNPAGIWVIVGRVSMFGYDQGLRVVMG